MNTVIPQSHSRFLGLGIFRLYLSLRCLVLRVVLNCCITVRGTFTIAFGYNADIFH